MHCLDSSALVDYLEGAEEIARFIVDHEHEPLFAPTVALYELFVGAARTRGDAGLDAAQTDLGWAEPMELSIDGAAEAARIDRELHAMSAPIGAMDTLIAGIVRQSGGTVVTADDQFDRVTGLDVHRYD